MVDVIIPTVSGREDLLERCIESYKRHTHPDSLNLIVVRDERTVGKAWLAGIEQSTAPYIHLSGDDLEVTSPTWAGACVEAVDAGRLPCPVIHRPDGSLESCGGDMSAYGCLIAEMQQNGTEVDFSPLPFGSREQVEAIGMLDIHYCSDVWFSYRGRQLGWPSVVVRGYEMLHHHSNIGRRGVNGTEMQQVTTALATPLKVP